MEMYEKAYQKYIEMCEKFEINQSSILEFIQNTTKEQIEVFLNS